MGRRYKMVVTILFLYLFVIVGIYLHYYYAKTNIPRTIFSKNEIIPFEKPRPPTVVSKYNSCEELSWFCVDIHDQTLHFISDSATTISAWSLDITDASGNRHSYRASPLLITADIANNITWVPKPYTLILQTPVYPKNPFHLFNDQLGSLLSTYEHITGVPFKLKYLHNYTQSIKHTILAYLGNENEKNHHCNRMCPLIDIFSSTSFFVDRKNAYKLPYVTHFVPRVPVLYGLDMLDSRRAQQASTAALSTTKYVCYERAIIGLCNSLLNLYSGGDQQANSRFIQFIDTFLPLTEQTFDKLKSFGLREIFDNIKARQPKDFTVAITNKTAILNLRVVIILRSNGRSFTNYNEMIKNLHSLEFSVSDANGIAEKVNNIALNIQIVRFDNITVQEQVNSLTEADIIISPHGAQMVWLLFARKKALIFVVCFPHFECYCPVDAFGAEKEMITSVTENDVTFRWDELAKERGRLNDFSDIEKEQEKLKSNHNSIWKVSDVAIPITEVKEKIIKYVEKRIRSK
jgi:hypothetical protein